MGGGGGGTVPAVSEGPLCVSDPGDHGRPGGGVALKSINLARSDRQPDSKARERQGGVDVPPYAKGGGGGNEGSIWCGGAGGGGGGPRTSCRDKKQQSS